MPRLVRLVRFLDRYFCLEDVLPVAPISLQMPDEPDDDDDGDDNDGGGDGDGDDDGDGGGDGDGGAEAAEQALRRPPPGRLGADVGGARRGGVERGPVDLSLMSLRADGVVPV